MIRSAGALLLSCSPLAASPQVVEIEEFQGEHSENFQSHGFAIGSCLPGRVFQDTADLCSLTAEGQVASFSPSSSACCSDRWWEDPWVGIHVDGDCEFVFDSPILRFGASSASTTSATSPP